MRTPTHTNDEHTNDQQNVEEAIGSLQDTSVTEDSFTKDPKVNEAEEFSPSRESSSCSESDADEATDKSITNT